MASCGKDEKQLLIMQLAFLKQSIAALPPGQRIYAVGDVHGMASLLEDVFRRIDADLAARPASNPVEVLLGDFIDRGSNSFDVINLLLRRSQERGSVLLAGNHEWALMKALLSTDDLQRWMKLGGQETLMSYGVTPPPAGSVNAAFLEFRERFANVHMALPSRLRSCHRVGDFLFVHAGIRPGVPLERQRLADLTTIRAEFLTSDADHGVVVVHGHTPVQQIDVRPNRINLDTCAYMTGNLTCLAIDRSGLCLI
jgi:serine/threonine protein phosphatase 1